MSSFLTNIAYRQYEEMQPFRYYEKPICNCEYCGIELFNLEQAYAISNKVYCKDCVEPIVLEFEREF